MSLIYFTFAVFFYAISQLQQHGKLKFKGAFWDSDSWNRKYKIPLEAATTRYSRIVGIKFKERFPLSATLFVFLTDGYHLSQMLFKVSVCAAIVSYKEIVGGWDMALYLVLFGVLFTVTYKYFSK